MFKSFVLILSVLSLTDLSTAQLRVIGGKPAKQGQFPYQVSLQLNGRHHCGGSIIAVNAIITAAHCTNGKNPAAFKVRAGTNNLKSGGILANVKTYTMHPYYNPENHDNDIAIVYLSEHLPIDSNPNVKNIEMVDSTTELLVGEVATISGWGLDTEVPPSLFPKFSILGRPSPPQLPTQLKYARIPLWDIETCAAILYPNWTPNMYCAGSHDGQISSCPGDSGGPLVVNGKLSGVVSGGFGCGAQAPSVYTHLAAMRAWINEVTDI